jgi:L-arabinokinase
MDLKDFQSVARRQLGEGGTFSTGRPVAIGRAPGRLDLMGGNDDYTGGLVFESTIREATFAAAQLRDDGAVVLANPQMAASGWDPLVTVSLDDLDDETAVRDFAGRSEALRWTAYTLGCLHYLRSRHADRVRAGLSLLIHSDVPLNKGVSSSASVEVAVMKTAAHAWGIDLRGEELATACQWTENVIAQSACGIMDQIAVTLGDEGCVLPMLCQPACVEPLVSLPQSLQVWAVDSGVSHQVSGIEYEAARAAAFMGYKLICDLEGIPVKEDDSGPIARFTDPVWSGYLANLPPSLFRARYAAKLPETLTGSEFLRLAGMHVDPFTPIVPEYRYAIAANTRYAVEENHRVHLFSELARGAGDDSERAFRQMGELMYQSHYAYSECGLGAEATDLLVQLAREAGAASGIFGAKITGGGAGGTVAFLGLKSAADAFQSLVRRFGETRGFDPYVFEGSSMGADRFGIATLGY